MNFFRNISIKARIALGFTLVSSFIVVISLIAYKGTLSSGKSYKKYSQINNFSYDILSIDKSISDLQRGVQNYIYTGYTAVAETANREIRALSEKLKKESENPEHGELSNDYFKRLQSHLENYGKAFNFAVEERMKRKELIDQLRIKLTEIKKSFLKDNKVYTVILESEKRMYEYLEDPNFIKVSNSLDAIDSVITEQSSEKFQKMLTGYKKNYFEIIQSTRGFLYLISVVMSAEAQEFSYVSSLLKNHVLSQVQPISEQFEQTNSSTQKILLGASLALILLAILFSFSISNGINRPLSRLTETFNKLAADEDVSSVPGLELKDEIGIMSKAADVFRQKNQHTKDLVKELDEKKAALEKSNEELDQFVYTVSHDLKSPIVTSMGFIGMMKSLAADGNSEAVMEKLPRLEKANRRMSTLVDDLLELSRLERVNEDVALVNMKEMINNVVDLHRFKLEEKKFSVNTDFDFPDLVVSETRISQVFENLISNAIKYCDNEYPELEIGCETTDKTYKFYVRDNGSGIAPEYHDKVFALFQRLRKDSEGTGIGLAIVKKVVKSIGGHIWIESPEKGSCTFWMEFPKIPISM